MEKITFYKYQGAGNDFVLIDQRGHRTLHRGDRARIAHLCDRRFGIGADGLILLQAAEGYDFEMLYFNADGGEGSLCGNGARCVVAFAHFLGIAPQECCFLANDGPHEAVVVRPDWIEVHIRDVERWHWANGHCVLNTGSPHYVRFIPKLEGFDVVAEGRRVRYSPEFAQDGINVNFVQETTTGMRIGTYERGVEDETLACGTGATAAAIAFVSREENPLGGWDIPVVAKGGELRVRFHFDGECFRQVWLCGPAVQVFSGEIVLG